MKIYLITAGLAALLFSCDQSEKNASGSSDVEVNLEEPSDKASYAYGVSIAENVKAQKGEVNAELVAAGIRDAMNEEAKLDIQESQEAIRTYSTDLRVLAADKNLEEGKAFLEENGKKEGIITLESGLQYEVLEEGSGKTPAATDKVTTHYHGTLIDGTVFDSSVDRGEPIQFPVNGVIPGWTEALQLMKEGSKWKLYVPSELAYKERGAGQVIGPHSTLIFEVELISVDEAGE
ncbi:MAG: FKBP-type peptidyl-prolyl cis-trans isomerase [Bacteroidota bacterium]